MTAWRPRSGMVSPRRMTGAPDWPSQQSASAQLGENRSEKYTSPGRDLILQQILLVGRKVVIYRLEQLEHLRTLLPVKSLVARVADNAQQRSLLADRRILEHERAQACFGIRNALALKRPVDFDKG